MDKVQPTHLNAYMMELQDAEELAGQATAKVARLKRQIDEKRVEQGLEPLYAEDDEKSKNKKVKKESTPEEASGFGGRNNNGGGTN